MSKENLKPNQVLASTMFVGVGGTGSRIVRSVAEMCRPEETENINFVCLDTNANDLQEVANSRAGIYYVQTSNTQTVGDYLDYDEDARRNWFPKNAVMYDKTVSEGAGQVRAISRLALNSTIKTGAVRPLHEAIDALFRKSGQQMKQALRVVMVSTASGGTGSGIILPLAMYIRDYVKNKYPNTALIVRSLIMLPETLDSVIGSSSERDSQRRNAYATIKEINAFMIKGSGFFDIDDNLKRYGDLHIDFPIPGSNDKKALSLLPFDFCFLMDGQDMEDSTLVNLKQYRQQAAQALYEQNIGPMQKNAFSVEDNIIKEMSNPGNLGRNRFGGIGASVLRYPYESVADFTAYQWALNAIGEGDAAKWGKYDRAYRIKEAEMKKKGLAASERPSRGEIYCSTMKNSKDPFSRDMMTLYLKDDSKRIKDYFRALRDHMYGVVQNHPAIMSAMNRANELAEEIDYKNDPDKKGRSSDNLDRLREFEQAVKVHAERTAQARAEAIFDNESKTTQENEKYMIESLLKNNLGETIHPNAARYLLYVLKDEFTKKIGTAEAEKKTAQNDLELYSDNADDPDAFDLKSTRKIKESSLDAVVDAERKNGNNQSIIGKVTHRDGDLYDKLNEHFVNYYDAIEKYMKATAELAAYRIGRSFAEDACKAYESFYGTFEEKVRTLVKRQNDIEDSLRFHKGDSVRNVCASRALLEELASSSGNDSALLSSELNGRIFDAIKSNVRFEREIENLDVVEEDKRIDIFDDIILGYFRDKVRRDCERLDMNIIEAIAMENRLQERIRMREEQNGGEDKKKLFDKVTTDDNERYIRKMIAMGERLAAPGIQKAANEEARQIQQVAYSRELDQMRNYRVDSMFGKGVGTTPSDSISRYEMHFFTALYNLTPDKINKFASPSRSETRKKNAGLYHRAYTEYSRNLGPDSTKNRLISTHIDKRWDNISVMPEIDFNYMNNCVMRVHQSLIYALVYGKIKYEKLSSTAGGKMIYRYENSGERVQEMIVSNGTLCDEFYEIVDGLYMDASIVEDIFKIISEKHRKDEVRNSNYEDTVFARSLKEFRLSQIHEGETSLFEIPVVYYNSLPNSQRFTSEINGLIDAVIETFSNELVRCETAEDAKFMLCDILKEQFLLLIDNYNREHKLNNDITAADNKVIDSIFRKIRKVMSTTPEPDDYEDTVREMKNRINEAAVIEPKSRLNEDA